MGEWRLRFNNEDWWDGLDRFNDNGIDVAGGVFMLGIGNKDKVDVVDDKAEVVIDVEDNKVGGGGGGGSTGQSNFVLVKLNKSNELLDF